MTDYATEAKSVFQLEKEADEATKFCDYMWWLYSKAPTDKKKRDSFRNAYTFKLHAHKLARYARAELNEQLLSTMVDPEDQQSMDPLRGLRMDSADMGEC